RPTDKSFHPVFYFSKRTSVSESKFHSFELETLALIYALRRFRIYLQGIPFKAVTDCNALKPTLDKKDVHRRISGWALELEAFDITLEHRSGDKMRHVDALSRANIIMIVEDNTFESNLII
ncbi:ribonuclease H family protein, partial [Enterobacter cloacae complex sp. 4DZ3-17B2]|uniref:Ty3/Gypsy family RNase HI domain-containing protein n=1 Tax=Enterobacter cloacae complex sp. 4DZ3-17B2 TaxID=2511990 RepID=UPI0013E9F0DF